MMVFTDALPTMAAVPPAPSASSSALPRRRDIQDAQDGHHASPAPFSAEAPHTSAGFGTVARGRPPSPYIGAGTIVAMQWVAFGTAILRHLIF